MSVGHGRELAARAHGENPEDAALLQPRELIDRLSLIGDEERRS